MGADGHIAIYDWDKVMEHWGEKRAEELRSCIFTGYIESPLFPGTPHLYHIYWGSNVWADPFNPDDWFEPAVTKALVKEVLDWMVANATLVKDWEVWT